MGNRQVAAAVVGAALCAGGGEARAWLVEDPLHASCHERITHDALGRVGYVAAPPALSAADARLRKSVQFSAEHYDANIYALSLIIGARWPDAQGAADFDFYQLAAVHNALGDQGAHCLRSETEDGSPAGDEAALADCHAQISRYYWNALVSVDAAGAVDPDRRELVTEFIPFVGRTQVPVSGFYVNAGIAMHAIEDSFTHAYRSDDGRHIRQIFNWSEQVRGTLDEARDGHGHETVLDNCNFTDPGAEATVRRGFATDAAVAFLQALTQPGSRDERQRRLDQFLADWMSYEPGCTLGNDYCAHPIQAWFRGAGKAQSQNYASGGCAVAGEVRSGRYLLGVLLAVGLFGLRRRRCRGRVSRSGERRGVSAPALVIGVGLLAFASTARADEAGAAHLGYHTEVRASLSVQNPAYAVGVSGAWAWRRAEVGGFVELNPWYSVEKRYTFLGSTNVGAFANYLHPIRPDFHVRAGVGFGTSILNQEWYGSDAGTMGLYLNLHLVGFVYHFDARTALTVDAFDMALPAPQLFGWPILYAQHRISIGLQF